jgi:prevent-host-death family protein
MCGMKEVTIREAQHNLGALLKEVERGEVVCIRRRAKPVARLVPWSAEEGEAADVDWGAVAEERTRIWGGKPAPGASTDEILGDLRGER